MTYEQFVKEITGLEELQQAYRETNDHINVDYYGECLYDLRTEYPEFYKKYLQQKV